MAALTITLLAPLLLLGLLLAMERVERPLRQDPSDDLDAFLDSAQPEEVEALIRDGYGAALERYWKRRRLARLIPGRPR